MAIVRRTFEQMRDEVMLRLGKANVPGWESRVEHFITAAYYDIALTFHHYELEEVLVLTIAEDATETTWRFDADVQYPNGPLYAIMGIRLLDGAGNYSTLGQQHIRFLWQEQNQKEKPKYWARTRLQTILFDRPSSASFDVQIYFYRYPDAPRFDPLEPDGPLQSELGWLWDEHILQHAMFLASPATWRYDISKVQAETLRDFLDRQIQAPLNQGLVARAEVPLSSQNQGGNQ